MESGTPTRTIVEAQAFVAAESAMLDPFETHTVDQGAALLADRSSLAALVKAWKEPEDALLALPLTEMADDEHEAVRLIRLGLAMAIVAKAFG